MNPWLNFFFTRFKPFVSLFVITGIAVSASTLDKGELLMLPLTTIFVFLVLTAFYLRLDNDIRDIAKDEVAYPARPFPSGHITKREGLRAIKYLRLALFILSSAILIFASWKAKVMVVVVFSYLFLLSRDFFISDLMRKNLLIRSMAQQGFIGLLAFFAISIASPAYLFSPGSFGYALLLFGAFFTYELCRKLDPYSHPASLAYIHYWGYCVIFLWASLTLLLSAVGAYLLGVGAFFWPPEVALFLLLLYLFQHPREFGKIQVAAALSLVIHSWSALFC